MFVFVGILGLISVRFVEDKIFYDPFLAFFKGDYKVATIPDFDSVKIVTSHLLRFLLNLFFSAIVVHFMFLNKKWTFHSKNQPYKHGLKVQLIKFILVVINSIFMKSYGTFLITQFIGIDYKISRLFVDLFVSLVFNFNLQKYWVFKKA